MFSKLIFCNVVIVLTVLFSVGILNSSWACESCARHKKGAEQSCPHAKSGKPCEKCGKNCKKDCGKDCPHHGKTEGKQDSTNAVDSASAEKPAQ